MTVAILTHGEKAATAPMARIVALTWTIKTIDATLADRRGDIFAAGGDQVYDDLRARMWATRWAARHVPRSPSWTGCRRQTESQPDVLVAFDHGPSRNLLTTKAGHRQAPGVRP